MRTIGAVVIVLCVGCKSESKQQPAPAPKETEKPIADTAHDIAKQPRTAIAGKTLFLEFTIDMPPSASMPVKGDQATSFTFKDSKLSLEVRDHNEMPTASKARGGPAPRPDMKITRTVKDEPGMYTVVDRKDDATSFVLEHCKDLDPAEPPSGICCKVQQESDAPIVDVDKLIAFADEVCHSIKVQNRKLVPAAGSAAAGSGASGTGSGSR